jgi:hypothetical protein
MFRSSLRDTLIDCVRVCDGFEWASVYPSITITPERLWGEVSQGKEPTEPYTIKEAVDYLGWLGGPKRAPSDGPPGVKTIWIGLMKLYILLAYREYLA